LRSFVRLRYFDDEADGDREVADMEELDAAELLWAWRDLVFAIESCDGDAFTLSVRSRIFVRAELARAE
jgi:hypothetical protein